MDCYIFDIDGTLADCQHRVHHAQTKEWDDFYSKAHLDTPIPHMVDLYKLLSMQANCIFVSGRNEVCRYDTIQWLRQHVVGCFGSIHLYMRKSKDRRPDNLVKSDILDQVLEAGWKPIMAFDDRDQVVRMWRERGVPCAQVAPGNF